MGDLLMAQVWSLDGVSLISGLAEFAVDRTLSLGDWLIGLWRGACTFARQMAKERPGLDYVTLGTASLPAAPGPLPHVWGHLRLQPDGREAR